MTTDIAELMRIAAEGAVGVEGQITDAEKRRLVAFANGLTEGIEMIAAELKRQIEEEGFGAVRDAAHVNDELARVAICYIASASDLQIDETDTHGSSVPAYRSARDLWPESWHKDWDKRDTHSRRRKLEIAGALIAAELDRLIRAG